MSFINLTNKIPFITCVAFGFARFVSSGAFAFEQGCLAGVLVIYGYGLA
jgi:hypothetical protein